MSLDESCSIEVAVRVRPMNAREEEQGVLPIINASEERKEVTIVRGGGNRQTRQTYTFDHVFTGYTTQSEVFDPMQPMIDSVMQGYEATVFAYGQTGTGKTHTMEGDVMDPNEKGVIPRSVEAIFDRLGKKDKYSEFSVSASYLEIYNEELTDLLVELPVTLKKAPIKPPPAGDKTPREQGLIVMEDKGTLTKPGRGMFVHGLSEHTVSTSGDVLRLIRRAQERRQVQETKMNKTSSRSHCVFTLSVTSKSPTDDGMVECSGKLHMVDLAGSECAKAAGDGCASLERERKNINQSLLTLGRVISTLRSNNSKDRIPYRDSKLTRLLQESLGGRCKTLIIATLSPSVMAVEESFSTLKYAQDAQGIQNKPVATSYYHVMAPGEMAGGGAGRSVGGSAESGGAVCEDWNALTLKMAHLHSRMENAEAKLAKKSAEQAAIVARAEKAESDIIAATEAKEKAVKECEALGVQLGDTKHELAKTSYVLAARRGTEERLTTQAHSLLHKLSSAEAESEGLHTTLAEAVAKTAAQLARRGAFCDAAGEGLGAAQARLASLTELLVAHRAASAEAAAEAEAAARTQAEALRGAASELMATGSTEVAAAAAALEAAAADAAARLRAGCDGLQQQAATMAAAAAEAHTEVAGSLAALETAAKGAEAGLGEWAEAGESRQLAAGEALSAREAALQAELEAAAKGAATRLEAGQGRLREQQEALRALLHEVKAAQGLEEQVSGALDALGGAALAATEAAAAELDGCQAAVAQAAVAQQAGQKDGAVLSALDGAGEALQGAHAAVAATLKTQRTVLNEALDGQAKGNASAAVTEGLRTARVAVDAAAAARVAEFAAAREKLGAQQAALQQTLGAQAKLRDELSEAVMKSVQQALSTQLDGLAQHLAGGVRAAVDGAATVAADADAAGGAAAAAGAAHGAASEVVQAAVQAWGESNEAVAAAVGRGVAEGEAAQKGLDAGTQATAERQAAAAGLTRAWAESDAGCRTALAEAGDMHAVAERAVRERQAAHAARVEALGVLTTELKANSADGHTRVEAAEAHSAESEAALRAAAEAAAEEAEQLGAGLGAAAAARGAAFVAEAEAIRAMRAARPVALEALLSRGGEARARAEGGLAALNKSVAAQGKAAAAVGDGQDAHWSAACGARRGAADAAAAALVAAEAKATEAAAAHTAAATAAAEARAARDAAQAASAATAAEAEAEAVGGVVTQLGGFRGESDAVVPVALPARAPQCFTERVARTPAEPSLREHFEANGDTPYDASEEEAAEAAAKAAAEAEASAPLTVQTGEDDTAKEAELTSAISTAALKEAAEHAAGKPVAELRALLGSHGLSADGKKPELLARLQRAAGGGGGGAVSEPSSARSSEGGGKAAVAGTPRRPRSDPEVLRKAVAAPPASTATKAAKMGAPGAIKARKSVPLKDASLAQLNSPGRVKS